MCVLNPKSFHWKKFQSNNFALLYFKAATGEKGGFLFLTPAVGTRSDNTYSLYDFLFPVLLPQRKTFNFMVSSPNSNINMPNKPQNNYLSIPADLINTSNKAWKLESYDTNIWTHSISLVHDLPALPATSSNPQAGSVLNADLIAKDNYDMKPIYRLVSFRRWFIERFADSRPLFLNDLCFERFFNDHRPFFVFFLSIALTDITLSEF